MKAADPVRAIFYGHNRDGTEPGTEGWTEIDRVVALLSLKYKVIAVAIVFLGGVAS